MKSLLLAGSLILAGLCPLRAQSLDEIVPRDKQQQFAFGVCLGGVAYITALDQYKFQGVSREEAHQKAMWWGVGVPAAAGLGKEIYDGLVRRHPTWTFGDSVGDFMTTALGGVTLVIPSTPLPLGQGGPTDPSCRHSMLVR